MTNGQSVTTSAPLPALRDNLMDYLQTAQAEELTGTLEIVSADELAFRLNLQRDSAHSHHLRFSALARDILGRAENAPIAQNLFDALQNLATDFPPVESELVTRLLPGLYQFEWGQRRVIYTVNHSAQWLTVYLIGHWREIYQRPRPA